jgi:predicted negative regulator of RcsB-dependent stress response
VPVFRLVLVWLALPAVVGGLLVFGSSASEREWLILGVVLCVATLLAWQTWQLRMRRRRV